MYVEFVVAFDGHLLCFVFVKVANKGTYSLRIYIVIVIGFLSHVSPFVLVNFLEISYILLRLNLSLFLKYDIFQNIEINILNQINSQT
jgi:hypothetical protein